MRVVILGDVAPPDPAGGLEAGALRRGVREVLGDASRRLGIGAGDVVVRFVGEEEIRELNRVWRGKDRPTDVLSFPSGLIDPTGRRHLGDIALCLPVAARQATRRRHTPRREAQLLALHGLLHLLGYDHETDDGEMEALERRLRQACLPPRA